MTRFVERTAGASLVRGVRALGRAVGLIRGLAGELSDQRAYARHLAAHGRAHSAAEWRRFSDARMRAKYQRAKCC